MAHQLAFDAGRLDGLLESHLILVPPQLPQATAQHLKVTCWADGPGLPTTAIRPVVLQLSKVPLARSQPHRWKERHSPPLAGEPGRKATAAAISMGTLASVAIVPNNTHGTSNTSRAASYSDSTPPLCRQCAKRHWFCRGKRCNVCKLPLTKRETCGDVYRHFRAAGITVEEPPRTTLAPNKTEERPASPCRHCGQPKPQDQRSLNTKSSTPKYKTCQIPSEHVGDVEANGEAPATISASRTATTPPQPTQRIQQTDPFRCCVDFFRQVTDKQGTSLVTTGEGEAE
ncbi:hypothetical protein BU23DRAFT_568068 [Bimuria novae-zelandiae CBS 107.79]|uniref:Uncharacterized protein n=1 Tax=Bimuria novae-zelandiae CBS 107.79 TaxID=1447943 RepID=A0A6A5VBF6_9PLEO|nr:hypothetical protein BU23DRAFT_568068 [Bimuria novae-zelandiae CBS 107.79]